MPDLNAMAPAQLRAAMTNTVRDGLVDRVQELEGMAKQWETVRNSSTATPAGVEAARELLIDARAALIRDIDALLPLATLIADTHSDAGLASRGIEGDALDMARKLRRVG